MSKRHAALPHPAPCPLGDGLGLRAQASQAAKEHYGRVKGLHLGSPPATHTPTDAGS